MRVRKTYRPTILCALQNLLILSKRKKTEEENIKIPFQQLKRKKLFEHELMKLFLRTNRYNGIKMFVGIMKNLLYANMCS